MAGVRDLYMIGAMVFPLRKSLLQVSLCLLAVFSAGCKKKQATGTPLAKVGEAVLTLEDVRYTFPQEFEQALPREQYLDFVKRWIDDEVIFQQAQKIGLEKDTSVARRIEDMRRKLLIEEFMSRENASESVEPDEGALSAYYEAHREDFRRKAPEWRFFTMRIQSLKEALELKPRLRGNDYLAQAAPHLMDPLPETPETPAYRKAQDIRACLQSAVTTTPVGQVAGPLTCPEGVLLVKILEKAESGSLIDFNDIRDHIAGILMMERKSKQREGTIARYKEGAIITFNLDKIPGRDTPFEESESATVTQDQQDPHDHGAVGNAAGDYMATPVQSPKPRTTPRPRPTPPKPADEPIEATENQIPSPSTEATPTSRSESPSAPTSDTATHDSP
jgi:peptidyl-prolyl cis-trans isomerase C